LTLDEIFEMWDDDCKVDPTDLGNAALDISKLHNRYLRLLSMENRELRKLESRYRQLYNLKMEYYQGNLNGTEDLVKLGWEPWKKVTLKADCQRVVEADRDVIRLTEAIGEQREKTQVLTSILKEVMSRSWNVRAAIDVMKFNAGA
jgi:hypothetical protein